MTMQTVPLATHEVRWFFEGKVSQYASLKQWFETTAPAQIQRRPDVGSPIWAGRLGDEPDIYLLVPGSDDMGIKWRERNFQVKGRTAALGTQVFCGRHRGKPERWVKWSYADVPPSYRRLFVDGPEMGLVTVAVQKTRALRKIRLDTLTGRGQEVAAETVVDRGIGVELVDLEVGGKGYCSLAFEAFPNDAALHAAFTQVVETFLKEVPDIALTAANSYSYPAWLRKITKSESRSAVITY